MPEMIKMIIEQFQENNFYCDDLFVQLIRSAEGTADYTIITEMIEAEKKRVETVIELNEISSNNNEDSVGSAYQFLGMIYEHGLLGNLDIEKGIDFYEKAKELNHSMAMTNLGHMYKYGNEYLEKNVDKALAYYQKAADLGNLDSMGALAAHEIKEGRAEIGLEKLREAARNGHKHSLRQLAFYYQEGLFGLPQDFLVAEDIYEKAIGLGDPDAMVCYGLLLERLLDTLDTRTRLEEQPCYLEIQAHYEEAVRLGSFEGMCRLAELYKESCFYAYKRRGGWSSPDEKMEKQVSLYSRILNTKGITFNQKTDALLMLSLILSDGMNYFEKENYDQKYSFIVKNLGRLMEGSLAHTVFYPFQLSRQMGESLLREMIEHLPQIMQKPGLSKKKYADTAHALALLYGDLDQTACYFYLEKYCIYGGKLDFSRIIFNLHDLQKKVNFVRLMTLLWDDLLLDNNISYGTISCFAGRRYYLFEQVAKSKLEQLPLDRLSALCEDRHRIRCIFGDMLLNYVEKKRVEVVVSVRVIESLMERKRLQEKREPFISVLQDRDLRGLILNAAGCTRSRFFIDVETRERNRLFGIIKKYRDDLRDNPENSESKLKLATIYCIWIMIEKFSSYRQTADFDPMSLLEGYEYPHLEFYEKVMKEVFDPLESMRLFRELVEVKDFAALQRLNCFYQKNVITEEFFESRESWMGAMNNVKIIFLKLLYDHLNHFWQCFTLDFMKKSTRRIPAAKTAGSIML